MSTTPYARKMSPLAIGFFLCTFLAVRLVVVGMLPGSSISKISRSQERTDLDEAADVATVQIRTTPGTIRSLPEVDEDAPTILNIKEEVAETPEIEFDDTDGEDEELPESDEDAPTILDTEQEDGETREINVDDTGEEDEELPDSDEGAPTILETEQEDGETSEIDFDDTEEEDEELPDSDEDAPTLPDTKFDDTEGEDEEQQETENDTPTLLDTMEEEQEMTESNSDNTTAATNSSSLSADTVGEEEELEAAANVTVLAQSSDTNLTNVSTTSISPEATKTTPNTTLSSSELPLTCQSTKEWLQEKDNRLPNIEIDDPRWFDYMIGSNPIEAIDDILGETLCHPQGQLRTTTADTVSGWNASNHHLLQAWEIKLMFLAMHDFHHRPAKQEHLLRKKCREEDDSFPLSSDYQCPGAKFMVTNLPNIGMGASIRLAGIANFLRAIASDRIPLVLAQTPAGPKSIQEKLDLASCPRGDLQCVFLPTTPCTVSMEDLKNATEIDGRGFGRLRGGKDLPEDLEAINVLVGPRRISPAKFDQHWGILKSVQRKIFQRAQLLIDEWVEGRKADGSQDTADNVAKESVLRAAAQRILVFHPPDAYDHYKYGHRYYRIAHLALLYILRPNAASQKSLNDDLARIIPADMDPQHTIGLPIRGSDKCDGESVCLPFRHYMQLAEESWQPGGDRSILKNTTYRTFHTPQSDIPERGHLIMTTEDSKIFQQRLHYENRTDFSLDFIVNEGDTLQGTGNIGTYNDRADHIMLSSMLALKMHFHAGKAVFGNCCSNFHVVLFDFLREGCGVLKTNEPVCMQETENYNICCGWSKTESCREIKRDRKAAKQNNTFLANPVAE